MSYMKITKIGLFLLGSILLNTANGSIIDCYEDYHKHKDKQIKNICVLVAIENILKKHGDTLKGGEIKKRAEVTNLNGAVTHIDMTFNNTKVSNIESCNRQMIEVKEKNKLHFQDNDSIYPLKMENPFRCVLRINLSSTRTAELFIGKYPNAKIINKIQSIVPNQKKTTLSSDHPDDANLMNTINTMCDSLKHNYEKFVKQKKDLDPRVLKNARQSYAKCQNQQLQLKDKLNEK